MDFFPDDFLIIIDESHMTIPQVRGMYAGDRSRKQTLVDYGFRLPSALDNRPLNFEEFETHIDQMLISPIRSSIWPSTGRTSTSGSSSPVGRMICSVRSSSWASS